ncbi:MAG TPA: hypothetical protein VIV60_12420, partial [Polyangiaceae bacterium]
MPLAPTRTRRIATVPHAARWTELQRSAMIGGAVVAGIALLGCERCGGDRPYTPFRVETAALSSAIAPGQVSAAQPTAPASAEPSPQPAPALVEESQKLEPPSGRVDLGSRQLDVPKDWVAERYLSIISETPSRNDALVWVIPAKADANWNGPMGELWSFPLGGDAKRVLELPAWVPSGPGCTHASRLARIGRTTVLLDVQAKCERSLPQRSPTRALALLTLNPAPALLLGLRVAETPVGESITTSALATDRDGDGREDPVFRFELKLDPQPGHAAAELGWLDRAAGASVDSGHLAKSIDAQLASWEAGLGKKAKAAEILVDVAALRRLLSDLCQDSAVPRVFDWRGETLRCSPMAPIAARLARIEVRAALTLGDQLAAARLLGFATTWHGGISGVDREDLRKRLLKSMATVPVGLPVSVDVRPVTPTDAVRYSPMRFDDDNTLLVQADRGGLYRINPDGTSTSLEAAEAGIAAWPLAVVGADGRRWQSVVPSCDRAELALSFKTADGAFSALVPTAMLAPRPGVCRSPAAWPIAVAPVAWTREHPTALIDGVCWSGAANGQPCEPPNRLGPVIPGSPRSPDGRRLIAESTLGPIVLGDRKPELWTGASLDGKRLGNCAVANDAKAIACIANGTILYFLR